MVNYKSNATNRVKIELKQKSLIEKKDQSEELQDLIINKEYIKDF